MGETVNTSQDSKQLNKNRESTFSLTFFVGMAIYLTLIVIIGFWPTYFGNIFLGQDVIDHGFVEISWKIHLHASVFMTWMAVLITQTVLVAQNNTNTHTKFGKYGFLFGMLVIAVGLFMTFVQMEAVVAKDIITWSEVFPSVLFTDAFIGISQFSILLGLAYYYRTQPTAHKRYILFATITLVNAATARWRYLIGGWSVEIIHLLMIGPIWVYDIYNDRRIHQATLIGTGIIAIYFLELYLL